MNSNVRIIAFYLPQFHPFKENDEWWGKGFTEWTNVCKAKPLFKGHNQPRIPTELGYYDLRLPIVREQQAQMARDAGVESFCYWHYWFGNGKRLIADIFDEVLNSGKPDFPFCLGWANHSWFAKNWNADGTTTNKLLIEQTYPGIEDEKMHFAFLLKAFKDKRYTKVNGCPLFYIFDPTSLPKEYLDNFRKWSKEEGFPDLYIVANISGALNVKTNFLSQGYDAVSYQRLAGMTTNKILLKYGDLGNKISYHLRQFRGKMLHRPPFMTDYKKFMPYLITDKERERQVIPTIVPQWDHTPRSGWNGSLFVNTSPSLFYEHVKQAFDCLKDKPEEERLVFLKSWNEWGEGNFMEPDLTFGRGFIEALRKAMDEYNSKQNNTN